MGDQRQPVRVDRMEGERGRAICEAVRLSADTECWEIYTRECDRLAEVLYVANYRRDEVRRYAYDRAGSEFIMSVPGPADTAVGTRVMQAQGAMNWR